MEFPTHFCLPCHTAHLFHHAFDHPSSVFLLFRHCMLQLCSTNKISYLAMIFQHQRRLYCIPQSIASSLKNRKDGHTDRRTDWCTDREEFCPQIPMCTFMFTTRKKMYTCKHALDISLRAHCYYNYCYLWQHYGNVVMNEPENLICKCI